MVAVTVTTVVAVGILSPVLLRWYQVFFSRLQVLFHVRCSFLGGRRIALGIGISVSVSKSVADFTKSFGIHQGAARAANPVEFLDKPRINVRRTRIWTLLEARKLDWPLDRRGQVKWWFFAAGQRLGYRPIRCR
jgi:hypothetical protein